MDYTVEQVAEEGYRRYIEVERGSYWEYEDALYKARRMMSWFLEGGMDLDAAADELAGTLYMEE